MKTKLMMVGVLLSVFYIACEEEVVATDEPAGEGGGSAEIMASVNDILDHVDSLIAAGACEEANEYLFDEAVPNEPQWSQTVACTTLIYELNHGFSDVEDTTECGLITYFSTSLREINDAGCILSLEPLDVNDFFTAFLDSVDYLVENSSCEPAWEFIMETVEHLDEPEWSETEACDELMDAFEDGLDSVEDTTDFCEMATTFSTGLRAIIDNDCLLGWAEDDDDDIDEYFFQTWVITNEGDGDTCDDIEWEDDESSTCQNAITINDDHTFDWDACNDDEDGTSYWEEGPGDTLVLNFMWGPMYATIDGEWLLITHLRGAECDDDQYDNQTDCEDAGEEWHDSECGAWQLTPGFPDCSNCDGDGVSGTYETTTVTIHPGGDCSADDGVSGVCTTDETATSEADCPVGLCMDGSGADEASCPDSLWLTGVCLDEEEDWLEDESAHASSEACEEAGGEWMAMGWMNYADLFGIALTFNDDGTYEDNDGYGGDWTMDGSTLTLIDEICEDEDGHDIDAEDEADCEANGGEWEVDTHDVEVDGNTLIIEIYDDAQCDCDDYDCDWEAIDAADDEESCEAIENAYWENAECIELVFTGTGG